MALQKYIKFSVIKFTEKYLDLKENEAVCEKLTYYVNKNFTPVLQRQEAESFGNVDGIEMDWIYLAQDRDQ
jgi:hypothetical protein